MPLNYGIEDSYNDLEDEWSEARLAQAEAMDRLIDDADLSADSLSDELLDDVCENTAAFADIDEVMHAFLSKPPPGAV